ncbi:MAG: hypothetical protein ACYC2K_04755 [Gemmatimonadales bacterium]
MWTTPARQSLRSPLHAWLAVLLSVTGCSAQPGPGLEFPPGTTRVLFIGNSLTYTNELPRMVSALAQLANREPIGTASATYANFGLQDHWVQGTARTLLAEHEWDFVVMQQGPSSLPESQVNLREWTEQFSPVIRAAGAEPVLYMVWPASQRMGDFPGVKTSYRNAAAAVSGIFAPAGDAWLAAWDETPTRALYGPDGFHPGMAGTYLAALVILERIVGVDPLSLPPGIPGSALDEATVRSLQRAARTALDRNPARPTP